MMTYDPFALVVPDKDKTSSSDFEVLPDVVYPATVARIREILQSRELPDELIDQLPTIQLNPATGDTDYIETDEAARMYRSAVRRVPAAGWDDALIARGEFEDDDPRLGARAQALEVARKWFTRALKNRVKGYQFSAWCDANDHDPHDEAAIIAFQPLVRGVSLYIAKDERYRL